MGGRSEEVGLPLGKVYVLEALPGSTGLVAAHAGRLQPHPPELAHPTAQHSAAQYSTAQHLLQLT